MRTLKPEIVATAARLLYGTAHSDVIIFLALKAAGLTIENGRSTSVKLTSTGDTTEPLRYLAWVSNNFATFVQRTIEEGRFDNNKAPLPTKPQAVGAPKYSLFFPITDNARYILRQSDTNRSVIWTRGTDPGKMPERAGIRPFDSILELVSKEQGQGAMLRFRPQYVEPASLYFGPDEGKRCSIPWRPFVIWCCRNDEFPDGATPTFEDLEQRVVQRFHLKDAERHFLFTNEWSTFTVTTNDFENGRSEARYDDLLCFANLQVPQITAVREAQTLDEMRFESQVLDLDASAGEDPQALAERMVAKKELNLLFTGAPRTGKSRAAVLLAEQYVGAKPGSADWNNRVLHLQFHQEWRYGDFIAKLTPELSGSQLSFTPQAGLFLQFCTRHSNSHQPCVLIIEEVNRANVAAVFGETFHLIEMGYRGTSLPLPYGGQTITVPPQLLVIATMNDLDRSTYALDYALISRFRTIRFDENYQTMYALLMGNGFSEEAALGIVKDIKEVSRLTKYPVGHAHVVNIKSYQDVYDWYETVLRPALGLFLTKYQENVLTQQVDPIMRAYRLKQDEANN